MLKSGNRWEPQIPLGINDTDNKGKGKRQSFDFAQDRKEKLRTTQRAGLSSTDLSHSFGVTVCFGGFGVTV
jgi:hypothetical protein